MADDCQFAGKQNKTFCDLIAVKQNNNMTRRENVFFIGVIWVKLVKVKINKA